MIIVHPGASNLATIWRKSQSKNSFFDRSNKSFYELGISKQANKGLRSQLAGDDLVCWSMVVDRENVILVCIQDDLFIFGDVVVDQNRSRMKYDSFFVIIE